MNALLLHRIHFGFNATFHYIFPQLTMGLALLLVVLKTVAVRRHDERYNDAARFWARIFAINFLLGVVTSLPMEFQFGTNWSQFARTTGGVIGQPLAMEGGFSFFLGSAFLGLFLFGEKRLSAWGHWAAAFLVFLGSWISGFFIIVTNAWMQHPVAYRLLPNGVYELAPFTVISRSCVVGAPALCTSHPGLYAFLSISCQVDDQVREEAYRKPYGIEAEEFAAFKQGRDSTPADGRQ
jgi:cytochrome d ubiquinol oxidase subunit I